jgi:hypothetical protein
MAHIIVFTPLLQGKVLGSLFQKQKLNLYLKERKIKVLGSLNHFTYFGK